MTQLLFKHLAIGDRFSFVEHDVDGERPVYIRRGRNKYSGEYGDSSFYTGLRSPVVLVEAARDRRYTDLEETLISALRVSVSLMEGPLRGMQILEDALGECKSALAKADRHFPPPKPPSAAPMHWTLPPRR